MGLSFCEDCTVEDWFNRHIWRYERALRPGDVYWGTLLGAAEMLLAGVTCVADLTPDRLALFRAAGDPVLAITARLLIILQVMRIASFVGSIPRLGSRKVQVRIVLGRADARSRRGMTAGRKSRMSQRGSRIVNRLPWPGTLSHPCQEHPVQF